MVTTTTTFRIKELDCSSEEQILRSRLKSIEGIQSISVNFLNRSLSVVHDTDRSSEIFEAITSTGLTIESSSLEGQTKTASFLNPSLIISKVDLIFLIISGITAFGSEIVSWLLENEQSIYVKALAIISIFTGGRETLKKGYLAARSFTLNINFLMTLAVIGALILGEWPEAAVVIFLFSIAELVEKYALEKARNTVRSLMSLTPDEARVLSKDGQWVLQPSNSVLPETTVRVKPGERIPLDGIVVSGTSSVNQAPITGESMPVEKFKGDKIFAGTINGNGILEFSTTGGKDETTLAKIIRAVQDAESQRAPTQRFVDSFARVYTPLVVLLAIGVAFFPPLFFSASLSFWLYKALVLLVIACPCALVISTPVTVVSGLAAAAKRGILIKGGIYLEKGKDLNLIALDKTGTLTQGKPEVTDVIAITDVPEDEVLKIAASVDTHSDHPVALAVSKAWKGELYPVESFQSITGRGAEARLRGETVFIGNHRLAEEKKVCGENVEKALEKLESEGKTTVIVAIGGKTIGVLGVADTPRESSIEAVKQLHELGIKTIMLSGDNQATVEAIARIVGIDEAKGNLLPEDKLVALEELQRKYKEVGMVGDGVNDAPALAKASIGFSMGAAGTDTALETADVALMQDDLRGLYNFIRLSKKTSTILYQNIIIAIGSKIIFFILAIAGMATMWMAVVADMGASLVVIFNGLRLYGFTNSDKTSKIKNY